MQIKLNYFYSLTVSNTAWNENNKHNNNKKRRSFTYACKNYLLLVTICQLWIIKENKECVLMCVYVLMIWLPWHFCIVLLSYFLKSKNKKKNSFFKCCRSLVLFKCLHLQTYNMCLCKSFVFNHKSLIIIIYLIIVKWRCRVQFDVHFVYNTLLPPLSLSLPLSHSFFVFCLFGLFHSNSLTRQIKKPLHRNTH